MRSRFDMIKRVETGRASAFWARSELAIGRGRASLGIK
jgi:hypothetical protein